MSTLLTLPVKTLPKVGVAAYRGDDALRRISALDDYFRRGSRVPLTRSAKWLEVLTEAFSHEPYVVEATREGRVVAGLCLCFVRTRLFGRFLVSLPYLNSSGLHSDDAAASSAVMDKAAALADELDVKYLELRNESAIEHPRINQARTDKVHMRLLLPSSGAVLWEQISAKVRNQVRKAQQYDFTVHWGQQDLVDDFYTVFSRNMRDLGTPTYSRGLFQSILNRFSDSTELCVVRDGDRAIAAALLLHGRGVTEVPSASSLKVYNPSSANMLLYWNLLERAAERGQESFDFGRSTENSPTFRFKKQWGAKPYPAEWQYYVRQGEAGTLRPDNPKYRVMIAIWRRLPLTLTRWLGPKIVRGIP